MWNVRFWFHHLQVCLKFFPLVYWSVLECVMRADLDSMECLAWNLATLLWSHGMLNGAWTVLDAFSSWNALANFFCHCRVYCWILDDVNEMVYHDFVVYGNGCNLEFCMKLLNWNVMYWNWTYDVDYVCMVKWKCNFGWNCI